VEEILKLLEVLPVSIVLQKPDSVVLGVVLLLSRFSQCESLEDFVLQF